LDYKSIETKRFRNPKRRNGDWEFMSVTFFEREEILVYNRYMKEIFWILQGFFF
jgi:hypothetical protein